MKQLRWNFGMGFLATAMLGLLAAAASATVRYVDLNNGSPMPPYTNWLTAAANIQDAIDVSDSADDIVVTNGVYQTGARDVYGMSNRVAVTKPVTVRSVNGAAVTHIVGSGPNGPAAVRCVYLTNAAVLAGFTLTSGATQTSGDSYTNQSGGGVWCESSSAVVSNCVLAANSAFYGGGGVIYGTLNTCTLTGNSANEGGGAYSATLNACALAGNSASFVGGGAIAGTLNACTLKANSAVYGGGTMNSTVRNCTLTANSASQWGGGAYYGNLYNCTLTGNSANEGGGAYSSTLLNCILYYNTAPADANYSSGTLHYCSTTPLPPGGSGNLTNPPLFVDTNGWGNLRLQAGSPCVNAGYNAYALDPTDLDGNPRTSGGTVDIGAYEYQFADPLDAWLAQYGLPTDGSSDYADTDHDGLNNWQEWVAGTNPTNALSVLGMLSATGAVSGVAVTWSSVSYRSYALERATNLGALPAFSVLQSNLAGWPTSTSWIDTNSPGSAPCFYRVRVEN